MQVQVLSPAAAQLPAIAGVGHFYFEASLNIDDPELLYKKWCRIFYGNNPENEINLYFRELSICPGSRAIFLKNRLGWTIAVVCYKILLVMLTGGKNSEVKQ